MKKLIFFLVLLSLGCSTFTSKRDELREKIQEFQEPKINDPELDKLTAEIQKIANASESRVGVDAVVIETGESVSVDGQGRYPMQSVYKLPISMAVLKQIEDGKLKLTDKIKVGKEEYVRAGQHSPLRDKNPTGAEVTVQELIRLAIVESDGTASDVLMRLAGGAGAVQSYLTSNNIGDINVLNTEKEIGQNWDTQYKNWATPEGATGLLRALHEQRGISKDNRELLLKFMIESKRGLMRLKGLLPPSAVVAHKTGTGGMRNGIDGTSNDIGIITLPNGNHLAIAVFVAYSRADEPRREAIIASIAKAAWDFWSKPE